MTLEYFYHRLCYHWNLIAAFLLVTNQAMFTTCAAKCSGNNSCPTAPSGNVLIYGGSGIFGSFLVDFFHERRFIVTNVDHARNEDAELNIILRSNLTMDQQAYIVTNGLPRNWKFNAIICTKTGWMDSKGNLGAPEFLKDAEEILKENLWSSMIASSMAPDHLHKNGVLVLTGGHLALKPLPNMIAYSVAKAAVHQLVRSIGVEGSGLPEGAKAFAILPAPMVPQKPKRRKSDAWNQLKDLAEYIFSWIEHPDTSPPSGSLVQFIAAGEKTDIVIST